MFQEHRYTKQFSASRSKSTLTNEERFVYDSDKYLLVSLDLPLVGQIEQASRAKPFLGLNLVLDFEKIRSLMHDADLPHEISAPLRPGLMVDQWMIKQLRLQEARCILFYESADVGAPGRSVVYVSASQFSREYRRFFGASPLRTLSDTGCFQSLESKQHIMSLADKHRESRAPPLSSFSMEEQRRS